MTDHLGTFVRITCAQNVQIIFRFIELVTGFHEPCVNRLVSDCGAYRTFQSRITRA